MRINLHTRTSEQPSKPISRLSRKLRDRERINEQNFNSRRIIKKYEAFPSLDQKISIDNSQSLDSFVRRIDDDWRKRLNRFNRCSITARNSKKKRLSRGLYIYRERGMFRCLNLSPYRTDNFLYPPLFFSFVPWPSLSRFPFISRDLHPIETISSIEHILEYIDRKRKREINHDFLGKKEFLK